MPYVTDAIYEYLPVKDAENIMISSYPVYDKEQIFKEEELLIDDTIEFIKNFRNTIKENNISKTYQVKLNSGNDLIIKMLKLKEKLIDKDLDITKFKVNSKNYEAVIYYEKVVSKEEEALKEKQIEELKNSIKKREGLLNNQNFVSKAPKDLVAKEQEKLQNEKEELAKLLS